MFSYRTVAVVVCLLATVALAGCAGWTSSRQTHRSASVVDYLYPNADRAPQLVPATTTLRPPVRVGIAFVPGGQWEAGVAESEKSRLLEQIKTAFAQYPYIGDIEVIPSSYLRARGGFENLDQVARMFNVEVVALLSYDQMQFSDSGALSMLYWTIVGAYVIHGDKYDVETLIDASVFDVASRKLLFRAPGKSTVKGAASLVGFSEQARDARIRGYREAVADLIPQLQTSLADFRERLKQDATVRVENKQGYRGAGSGDVGWAGLLIAALLGACIVHARRRIAA